MSDSTLSTLRAAAALLLLGLLTACSWFDFGDDDEEELKPAELVDFEPEVDIKRLWKVSVGSGQGKKYHRLVPVMDLDTIYVASADGKVAAINAENGKRLWRSDVDTDVSGGTGVGSGLVLLGTTDGEVIALDQADGRELWRVSVGSEVLAAPTAGADVAVVQTFDGHVYGLDIANGSERWTYETTLPVLTLRGNAAPRVADGQVYAAFANGKVVALDLASGSVRWEARVAAPQGQSEIERIVDIDGPPLIAGTQLFSVSYQGRAGAIDRVSGRPVWMVDASSHQGLALGLSNVVISSADGTVVAHDSGSGAVRWQQDQLLRRGLSAPTAFRSWAAVADFEGYVHLLSLLDGRIVGRVRVDSDGVRADMLARSDRLYVYGNGGVLSAFRVSSR